LYLINKLNFFTKKKMHLNTKSSIVKMQLTQNLMTIYICKYILLQYSLFMSKLTFTNKCETVEGFAT